MSPILAAGFFGIEHFTPPWDVFYLPLFNLLVLAYRLIFNDFALAIIVFTVVIRTILAPLFVQQIRSQKEMQRMQPLVREVQRKHKGNQQKIQQETMALYREHGVNPASGCLPIVLQLPILYALYQALIRASGVVQNFIPNSGDQAAFDALKASGLVHAMATPNHYEVAISGACNLQQYSQLPQFLPLNCQLIDPLHLERAVSTVSGWLLNPITGQHLDLAQPDHVFAIVVGGFGLSFLAVIAAVLQFVQVKMTSPRPNPDDPTSGATSTMTYLFPLLTVFWGGLFPSGLILYWVVYTAYLVGHQFLIMGWGNLFPIFGWAPSGRSPATEATPTPRSGPRSTTTPAAKSAPRGATTSAAKSGSRSTAPPSPRSEPRPAANVSPGDEPTNADAGQPAAPGARATNAPRPAERRPVGRKKRGRRR